MIITTEIIQVLLFSSFMAAAAGRTKLVTRSMHMRTTLFYTSSTGPRRRCSTVNYVFDQSDIGDLKSGSKARFHMNVVYSFQVL